MTTLLLAFLVIFSLAALLAYLSESWLPFVAAWFFFLALLLQEFGA